MRSPCGVLYPWQRDLVLMISAVAGGPGSLVLLVSLSFWPSGAPFWFGHCLSVSGVHRTMRSLHVSPHYALSAIQVSILVPVHWPPSVPQPSGSVLAFAVLAVFCAPDSENWSWWYPLLPVAWIPHLPCYLLGGMTHCAVWPVLFSLGFHHRLYHPSTPCQHYRFPWWFRYIGLPRRVCRLVLSWHSLSLRCCMRLSAWPSLVAISCCRLVPSSSLLAFRFTDTVCRVACPLLPEFLPPLLSSISTMPTLQVLVVVPLGSLLHYRFESSWCGPSSGSSLSQSLIGTMVLPPPSWCLVGVFAMWSPWRVELVSDLDQNEVSLCTFPRDWCRTFTMGSPISGRVAYFCPLDRNEGVFYPSILSSFAMGSTYGSSVVFLPLDRHEVFFGYLVCIPSGWGHPFRV